LAHNTAYHQWLYFYEKLKAVPDDSLERLFLWCGTGVLNSHIIPYNLIIHEQCFR
jgi:hypothetical protein